MNEHKHKEKRIMLALAFVGLVCLLAYTFKHTGGLLAQYVHPFWVGYVAAFGIESTIAGMSYRLANSKQHSRFLVAVLIVALIVSAIANIAEGFQSYYGEPLTIANLGRIDVIQAFVWISATGLISLLVFAISEIVGDDVNTVSKQAKRKSEQGEPLGQTEGKDSTKQKASDNKQKIYDILDQGERIGPRPMAELVKCSPATAKKWIDEYYTEGAYVPPTTGGTNGN